MKSSFLVIAAALLAACNSNNSNKGSADSLATDSGIRDTSQQLSLPEPDTNASKNKFSKVIGWPADKAPVAPAGFSVTKFATDYKSPRNIYVAKNGDVFVVLSNSERSL